MFTRTLVLCAGLIGAVSCSKSGAATATGDNGTGPDKASLEAISARLERIEKRLRKVEEITGALEPDPAETYSMAVAGYPSEGPATAKVTLVEGFEFACPFCYKVRPTVAALKAKYKDDLRVVYKQLIVHQQVAVAPALAACAAHKQGKYKQMQELIWEEGFLKANSGEEFDPMPLAPDNLKALAGKAGLDVTRYETDAMGEECLGWLRDSHTSFAQLSVGATPAFFINGRFLSGAQPEDEFVKLIDEEMAKADKAIAAGTKAESYYEDAVVKKGKTELE
jgi:protein-disulfide isomerase